MSFRYYWSFLIIVTCLFVVTTLAQQPQTEPGQVRASAFMRAKLTPAQNILEGIALADFEMINQNVERIRHLTLDEAWMVRQTDGFRRESEEFTRSLLVMQDAAKQKNLEGAILGYMRMTLKCVECHRQLRDVGARAR